MFPLWNDENESVKGALELAREDGEPRSGF
jgi:hypothetical protein